MKNPHAQALGRLAAGVPKNYSKAERARRAKWARGLRKLVAERAAQPQA
jgi:hypothetical protein